jgi:hypothetical protein
VVDGRHRVRLCHELGIGLRRDDISDQCATEDEMRAYVRVLNQHRRAISQEKSPTITTALANRKGPTPPARVDRGGAAAVDRRRARALCCWTGPNPVVGCGTAKNSHSQRVKKPNARRRFKAGRAQRRPTQGRP